VKSLKHLLGLYRSGNLRDDDLVIGVMQLVAKMGTENVLPDIPHPISHVIKDWVDRYVTSNSDIISECWSENEINEQRVEVRKAAQTVAEWFARLRE
jgi:hypothetical protein